ncbi:Guanine-nucleotide exchange factor [Komagataella phaffii CBS 7435]|uniref:SEC7 domain-containing protein n=2 Tax=Komagataella phaffii TaxID=460519 RepID=C4R2Y4_KOMPG|nr:uncharacterized protein PAS_chr2-2_0455 [Komagataella phaffii GS115]AOA62234.1 GQ67_01275T0 [Komagataella phaffii]CAH2447585.1 Guanine-nucleotide exchange factor [Komagataella phaffii CBS 7435]AOA67648.1 GQ68_00115T0 [Komagataella phaffii GS115]CAY69858.1 hypothetical protein PAS_chr2-2_0455 [Komagataella phaffii GS115]CCA37776.1 Guanine-nucleotide exchange factor [Komagataella phaffii CBS 7435]
MEPEALVGDLQGHLLEDFLNERFPERNDIEPFVHDVEIQGSLIAQAKDLYRGKFSSVGYHEYLSYMSDTEKDPLRSASLRFHYMNLFHWDENNLLNSLRLLCHRLYFRGESQKIDTLIDDFAYSWSMNSGGKNVFGTSSGVYLVAYSLVLLNTDLHETDQSQSSASKISRANYVKNTTEALISNNVPISSFPKLELELKRMYLELSSFALQLNGGSDNSFDDSDFLQQLQLKALNASKRNSIMSFSFKDKSLTNATSQSNFSTMSSFSSSIVPNGNRHSTPIGFTNALRTEKQIRRVNSRASNLSNQTNSTSRTASSVRSSMTFFNNPRHQLFKFESNALSQDDDSSILNDRYYESSAELELQGPPWCKEGNIYGIKFAPNASAQRFSNTTSRLFSNRREQSIESSIYHNHRLNLTRWNRFFVVVAKGELNLFTFSPKYTQASKQKGETVGSGNSWTDNATLIATFNLCSCLAMRLQKGSKTLEQLLEKNPVPSTNKKLDQVYWALALPSVNNVESSSRSLINQEAQCLVFMCNSKETSREFVDTCNYWSGRLSSVPTQQSISSIEYGWSEKLLNLIKKAETNSKNDSPDELLRYLGKLNIAFWKPMVHGVIPTEQDIDEQIKALEKHIEELLKDYESHKAIEKELAKLDQHLRTYSSKGNNFLHFWSQSRKSSSNDLVQKNYRVSLLNWKNRKIFLENEMMRIRTYLTVLHNSIKLENDFIAKNKIESNHSNTIDRLRDKLVDSDMETELENKIIVL